MFFNCFPGNQPLFRSIKPGLPNRILLRSSHSLIGGSTIPMEHTKGLSSSDIGADCFFLFYVFSTTVFGLLTCSSSRYYLIMSPELNLSLSLRVRRYVTEEGMETVLQKWKLAAFPFFFKCSRPFTTCRLVHEGATRTFLVCTQRPSGTERSCCSLGYDSNCAIN